MIGVSVAQDNLRLLVPNISVYGMRLSLEMAASLNINHVYGKYIQSGPKKCIHSLLINIFGIN